MSTTIMKILDELGNSPASVDLEQINWSSHYAFTVPTWIEWVECCPYRIVLAAYAVYDRPNGSDLRHIVRSQSLSICGRMDLEMG